MTSSSLNGKPDDYVSRKSWTNRDWFTHVGAWENEQGQLCFGSTIAFCAMMEQFHRTHTQHTAQLLAAANRYLDFRHTSDIGLGYGYSGVHPETELKNAIAAATGAA